MVRRQDGTDVAAPGMAGVGRALEPEVGDELVHVFGEVAQAVAGLGLVRFAVAPEVRRHHVVTAGEMLRHSRPAEAVVGPAMDQQQVRGAGVAPLPVVQPDACTSVKPLLGSSAMIVLHWQRAHPCVTKECDERTRGPRDSDTRLGKF